MTLLVSPELSGKLPVIRSLKLAAVSLCLAAAIGAVQAQQRGGVISVALSSEPPTLDPMGSVATLTAIVTQHITETLYTVDKDGNSIPLLAAAMPETSADGLTHTIKLRTGVPFHDGRVMTAKDVHASLTRWMRMTAHGKTLASMLVEMQVVDDATLRIKLNQKFAPLTQYLGTLVAAPAVMPAGLTDAQYKRPIGTGPYKLKEHRPDQYIQLARFEDYKMSAGQPNGFGGARKQYADEIRLVPVPDASTRLEAALAGQYDYVEAIPTESAQRLRNQKNTEPFRIQHGWNVMILNQKKGPFTNDLVRKALQASLDSGDMLSGYGKDFYGVNGSIYPTNSRWYSKEGLASYNQKNPKRAGELLKQAKYDGAPIRFITSRYLEDQFRLAQVASEYMKAAGFKVDLEVFDWATMSQRRANVDLWNVFIVTFPFYPDPSLITTIGANAPSGWTTATRAAGMHLLNTETDPARRLERWGAFQKLIYAEVPFVKIGDVFTLAGKAPALKGVDATPYVYFWNAYRQR